ncbi:hypothetical protein HanRHA438_Chr03g0123181 [Helianthus annuus]|nr:hypothetical protein HanRHA438_Chr03g0123181 [Helianthus annuus]
MSDCYEYHPPLVSKDSRLHFYISIAISKAMHRYSDRAWTTPNHPSFSEEKPFPKRPMTSSYYLRFHPTGSFLSKILEFGLYEPAL